MYTVFHAAARFQKIIKKVKKNFEIHEKFIFFFFVNYETYESCQIMFLYVIFLFFTFIKMFIFHIVSLFYLIQDLSENLICYMIEDKRHVSDIIFYDSFYFTS